VIFNHKPHRIHSALCRRIRPERPRLKGIIYLRKDLNSCQMKSILCLFGMLAVATASGFYDLPAYNDNGQAETLSHFQGNVTLVVNTAHL
jgi:hypothetical protein